MARTVLKWLGGTIDFDAVETEAPEHEATLTEYPVELGANLVDHLRMMPVRFRMTVVLSNSPTREDVRSGMDGALPSRGIDAKVRTGSAPSERGQQVRVRQSLIPGVSASVAGIPLTREASVTADAYLLGGEKGARVTTDSVVRADVRVWGGGVAPIKRITSVYAELRTAMAEARRFTVVCDLGDFDGMVLKSIRPQRNASNAGAPRFDLEFQQLLTATLATRDVSSMLPKKPRSKPPVDAGTQQPAAVPAAQVAPYKSSALKKFKSKVAQEAGL